MEYAWIATRDDEVEAALTSDALLVRPAEARVPAAMAGTKLGEIFERLVRMNDGPRHAQLRRWVEKQLSTWDADRIAVIATGAASLLPAEDVAPYTVATVAGLPDPRSLLPAIHDFAAAIAANATPDAVARGIAAAEVLLASFPQDEDPDAVANTLGFLFQATAATARLIEDGCNGRTGPPVLMTRRYADRDVDICGARVRKGDAVVIVLSSPQFYFGAGRHACPGREVAQTIAGAAVAATRAHGGVVR
jgi:hypothetical protein